jgi:spore germination protein (amino acid permease)
MKQYQNPKMGLMCGSALVLIGTSPRLFLQTFTEQFSINGQAAWLGIAMNSLSSLIMLLVLLFINKPGGDLLSTCSKLLGKRISWMITLFYSLIFLFNASLLLRDYVESTKISALHDSETTLIVLVYGFAIAIAAYLGIEAIARAGCFILPFILVGSLLVTLLLYPFYQVYNLFPLLGNGFNPLLISGFRGAGYNLQGLVIVILAPSFQNMRTMRSCLFWGLGGSTALKLLYALILLIVFGVEVTIEKILPFFEMARLVFINHYIQRIEAPFIILWVMFGILAIALSLYISVYLVTRLLQLTTLRPLIPLFVVIVCVLSMLPENIDQVNKYESMLLNAEDIGIYLIQILLLAAHLIKGKRFICSSEQS